MLQRLVNYLHNPKYLGWLILSFVALIGILLLVFTPVRYEAIIEPHRRIMMWGLVCDLCILIIWLAKEISDLHIEVTKLKNGEDKVITDQPDMYHFYDEKGDLKLSVHHDMLYYLESADNYVQIFYISGGRLEKMMVRNTMKNIEWRFRDKGLVRCHRSYIVNIHLVRALKRQDNELILDFGDDKIKAIPVSKGYGEQVIQHLTNNQ